MTEQVDWGERFSASYRLVRVGRSGGDELGEVPGFLGTGSIMRDAGSETYETAELDLASAPDLGSDLVRVYLDATFESGREASVALATLVPAAPSREADGPCESCTVAADGRLSELASDRFSAPVSYPAGMDPVLAAADLCAAAGVGTSHVASGRALSTPWVFGMDESGTRLDAVNALLDLAGYRPARTDPMGRVVMAPPPDLSAAPSWELVEGPTSRFLSDVTDSVDDSEAANVVIVTCETDSGTVVGEAVDDDPSSRLSVPSLGYRRVARYDLQDSMSKYEADLRAREILGRSRAARRDVRVSHVHCPALPCDLVALSYPTSGVDGTFEVTAQSVELGSAGCLTESTLTRWER